jgi:hypothetical protein
MRLLLALFVLLGAGAAAAGEADVLDVKVRRDPGGTYSFAVTVRHADQGEQHYADRWEVVAPNGAVLATRALQHPHVREQPFTRGLAGVKIPAGIRRVKIRAHDKVHGDGGKEVTVDLPR